MALKDIISNQELKDDAVLKIGEQEFKVGDLRAELSAPPEGYIPRAEYDSLATKMNEQSDSVRALLAAAAKGADANNEPPPQTPQQILRGAMASLLNEPDYNYEEDKYIGPFAKKLRAELPEATLRAADERYNPRIEQLKKDQDAYQRRLAITEMRTWYRAAKKGGEIPENPSTKKLYTGQELAKYAFENKVLDPDGWPDYDAVVERISAPTRHASELEKARLEGFKQGRQESRNNLIAMPGGRSARIGDTKPPIETAGKSAQQMFAEALGAAVQDPEIIGELEEA